MIGAEPQHWAVSFSSIWLQKNNLLLPRRHCLWQRTFFPRHTSSSVARFLFPRGFDFFWKFQLDRHSFPHVHLRLRPVDTSRIVPGVRCLDTVGSAGKDYEEYRQDWFNRDGSQSSIVSIAVVQVSVIKTNHNSRKLSVSTTSNQCISFFNMILTITKTLY